MKNFKITNVNLKEHQIEAIDKALLVDKFLLIAKPGLGKTLIAMIVAINNYQDGKINKILWITPPNLIKNLEHELKKHINYLYHSLFIFISQNQISKYIDKYDNYQLVIDECHNFKNFENAERAVKIFELSDKASKLLVMTGTPKGVNHNADLFYAYRMIIQQDADYKQFVKEFCKKANGKIIESKNTNILLKLLENNSIWLDKSKLNLPNKHHNIINVRINDNMKELISNVALYNMFKYDDKLIKKTSQTALALNSGQLMARTKDESINIKLNNNKIDKMLELIETIIKENQAIIYFTYHFELEDLKQTLSDNNYKFAIRYGDMTQEAKQEAIDAFVGNKVQFLVASIQSSNSGLTLINAYNIIYYNVSFSPTELEQSQDRIHRIGQTNDCYYYYLSAGAINNCIIQSQLEIIEQCDKMFLNGGDVIKIDYDKLMRRLAINADVEEVLERETIINELLPQPNKKSIPILYKFKDIIFKNGNFIHVNGYKHQVLKPIVVEVIEQNQEFNKKLNDLTTKDNNLIKEFNALDETIFNIVEHNNYEFINSELSKYKNSISNFFYDNTAIDPVINSQVIGDHEVMLADTVGLIAYNEHNELSFYDFVLYDIDDSTIKAMKYRNKLRNKILKIRTNMVVNNSYLIQFKKNQEYFVKNI